MASDIPVSPDFIKFLFSTKPKFDCYFIVGNKSQQVPERIGAVKLMLMAHSEVLRLELEDSDLSEKGDVKVEDINPDTFRGMLKYVYGHDTIAELCFDDADNMLYVAEKYMINTLKDKLAVRLMELLNPKNICSLLNNPACYKHLELNCAMTEILRFETNRVLESPQFLEMNTEGFLKILEQDGLAVPEIELWRAAMKWAKHRVNSEDGKLLRQQVCTMTKHLRLYTLTGVEIFEIIPSGFLSIEEINSISLYQIKKEIAQGLNDFSNEIEPRNLLQSETQHEIKLCQNKENSSVGNYTFTLLTKKGSIKFLPLECKSKVHSQMDPENWTYKVDCTTTITKVANPDSVNSSSTNEPPITLTFSENVKYGVTFKIPLDDDGGNVTFLPDTKYTIKMKVNGAHRQWYRNDKGSFNNDHFRLSVQRNYDGRSDDYYCYFPSENLQYRVSTVN